MASGTGPKGSLVMLWAGEDPALHGALLEQLDSAGIRYIDKPIGNDPVAPLSDPLPLDWKPRFGFEVAVASWDFAAADKILDTLLEEEPVDLELPEDESAGPPAVEPTSSSMGKTTVAIWSGDDQERARFLTEALKENEIPVRVENAASQSTLYVPPEEETLSREIIREILEGAPPA